jgi:uncharacterized protein Smg (DUF494 family)
MHERIIDLIIYFVTELRAQKRLKDIDTTSLSQRGYSTVEISTAYSWVHERLRNGQPTQLTTAIARQSFRVLNEAERMVIEQQSFGYLMQCHQLSLISNEEVEGVIERCMSSNNETVTLSEIKFFIGSVLFEKEMHKNIHARIMLDNPDSIH